MSIRSTRERINLRIYGSKTLALGLSRSLIVLVSLLALASLILYHGFPQTEERKALLLLIIQISFAFYIFNYLLKIFYSFEPLTLMRETWFEGIIMAFLIVEGISYNTFGVLILSQLFINLGIKNITHYYTFFIQIYFLAVVAAQILRSSNRFVIYKFHPSYIFISTFLLIAASGTGLLMLPEMTDKPGSIPFIDALFTSTSATCVTGLILYDTPTYFSFKGQLIILLLMKLGGLNIIAFGSFVALASKFGLGVKQHSVLEDFVNRESVLSSKGMLGRVIVWSFTIEIIGSLCLFLTWMDEGSFGNMGDRVFFSVFHSFSAFNNAGFSLFTDGFFNEHVRNNYVVQNIISILMFLGALGFIAIFDIFDITKMRERAKYHWKELSFSTKIALYFSIGLIAFGSTVFYFTEAENSLQGRSAFGIITTSVFQSISARTTGFNTVEIRYLSMPMILILLFLMFVGASSSSTGGGIKTSTFALLWASTIATVRGRKNPELFKRSISKDLIFRANSVFFFFIVGNLLGIFLLTLTENEILNQEGRSLVDLIFEEVSAFSTVGLSTGITSSLSNMGKIIIIVSMFVGRVGTLTVAFALGAKTISTGYKFPNGHTMVG